LYVQGGEVLIQKETMDWLATLRHEIPGIRYWLITNANVGLDRQEQFEAFFELAVVSFVGFQPETYRRVMGISVEKTKAFVESLAGRAKVRLVLKYLLTPSNLHEVSLFVDWAISLSPEAIQICNAQTEHLIRRGLHSYWDKITQRTLASLARVLKRRRAEILANGIAFIVEREAKAVLGMDEDFLRGLPCWSNPLETIREKRAA
jgi:pyruvate-formate lyase-activating enzyme